MPIAKEISDMLDLGHRKSVQSFFDIENRSQSQRISVPTV